MNSLSRFAPQALAVLRIVTALLFIEHGTQKLFSFPAMQAFGPGGPGGDAAASGPPGGGPGGMMATMMLVAGILETVGGLAVLVGFFTRPVAFVLAGEMAVAFWMLHFQMGGLFPVNNGGDAAVLFCFVFLYLVFAGAGDWSVDRMRSRPAAD